MQPDHLISITRCIIILQIDFKVLWHMVTNIEKYIFFTFSGT